jgi:Holliday junction resolvase RusA-like endonuclease
MVKSRKARAFVRELALAVRAHDGEVRQLLGPVRVDIVFFLPSRRSDGDNRIKALLDGLQGIAYANDRQVLAGSWEVRIDKGAPRAEVMVNELLSTQGGRAAS